jgi:hypothetical protein
VPRTYFPASWLRHWSACLITCNQVFGVSRVVGACRIVGLGIYGRVLRCRGSWGMTINSLAHSLGMCTFNGLVVELLVFDSLRNAYKTHFFGIGCVTFLQGEFLLRSAAYWCSQSQLGSRRLPFWLPLDIPDPCFGQSQLQVGWGGLGNTCQTQTSA